MTADARPTAGAAVAGPVERGDGHARSAQPNPPSVPDAPVRSDPAMRSNAAMHADPAEPPCPAPRVALCGDIGFAPIAAVASRFGVELVVLPVDAAIPGTYWGAPEAGLVGNRLFARADTPVHSALHELAHFVCMSPARRSALDTDAGGSVIEECAVCYLQLRLADLVDGFNLERALADMDAWGYSFREGSAAAWFAGDGRDAREWLMQHGLIDASGRPTWRLRGDPKCFRVA